jgi:hypothetical protein
MMVTGWVITIVGIVGGIATTVSEFAGVSVGAGFSTMALAGMALVWRMWRREVKRLETHLRRCEYQTSVLVQALTNASIQIPARFWASPADAT